jgi:DNA-binding YbaB/EbfC family protein
MKLPKNFGTQNMGDMMKQAQSAMARAQNLEEELKAERFVISQNGVSAEFNGTGELQKLSIDPELIDPEDKEGLEDILVGAIRSGFNRAVELRAERVNEILPNMPNIPGLNF